MRHVQLFEGPQEDQNNLNIAKNITNLFYKWLTTNNTNQTFNQLRAKGVGLLRVDTGPTVMRLIAAEDVGVPAENVFFGFIQYKKSEERDRDATMSQYNGMYIIAFCVDYDIDNQRNLASLQNWPDFVHEITHFIDYHRGFSTEKSMKNREASAKLRDPVTQTKNYYNDSLEFNAYYKQGLYMIMEILEATVKKGPEFQKRFKQINLSSYEKFKEFFITEFDDEFIQNLRQNTQKRFEKRFYQFFKWLEKNYPNFI